MVLMYGRSAIVVALTVQRYSIKAQVDCHFPDILSTFVKQSQYAFFHAYVHRDNVAYENLLM